jgi:hypothetical protein
MRYYIREGADRQGPFDVHALHGLAEKGELSTDDLLTTEDGSARIRAGLVVGVFGPPQEGLADELESATRETPAKPGSQRRFLALAVALILTGLLLPFVATLLVVPLMSQKLIRDRQELRAAMSRLVAATFAYAADNDDRLPLLSEGTRSTESRVQRYLHGGSGIAYGADRRGDALNNRALSHVALSEIKNPKATLLFFETNSWSDGKRVVATADGSVLTVNQAEFDALRRAKQ